MYRSLRRASSMVVKEAPDDLTNGSCWDQLSCAVWDEFLMNQQCEEVYRSKIYLWEWLYLAIKAYYPRYGLYLVGSTSNGFGTDTSDVDLCMMIHKVEVDQRTQAPLLLNSVSNVLSTFAIIDELRMIHAKVPLLKFRDIRTGLYVDLNCNNSVGMRNTNLLYCYSQHGVRPAVLPCLQKSHKNRFSPDMKVCALSMHDRMKPYGDNNKQTLGELTLRFLQYYASFDYSRYAVSVRVGSTIPIDACRFMKSPKNDPLQWRYICIEEPFDLTNTARSVHDPQKFQLILDVFRSSAEILARTRDLGSVMLLSSLSQGN